MRCSNCDSDCDWCQQRISAISSAYLNDIKLNARGVFIENKKNKSFFKQTERTIGLTNWNWIDGIQIFKRKTNESEISPASPSLPCQEKHSRKATQPWYQREIKNENCDNQKFAKRIKGINFACYLQCSQLNMIRAQIQRNILHMLQLFPFVWLSPNWSLELETEARELQIDICTSSLDTQLDRQKHDEWERERG